VEGGVRALTSRLLYHIHNPSSLCVYRRRRLERNITRNNKQWRANGRSMSALSSCNNQTLTRTMTMTYNLAVNQLCIINNIGLNSDQLIFIMCNRGDRFIMTNECRKNHVDVDDRMMISESEREKTHVQQQTDTKKNKLRENNYLK